MLQPQLNLESLARKLDAGGFNPDDAAESLTLPSVWYYDSEIFELEQQRLFLRAWVYVGHVTDLNAPGRQLAAHVGDQAVLVIRNDENELQAFDSADLRPVRVEVYAGLLFVNFDTDAVPLASQASQLLEAINRVCPDLAHMKCAHRATRDVAANWKTIVDNNHECYHCAVNHPDLMAMTDYSARATWSDEGITFVHTLDGYSEDSAPFTCEHSGTESLYSFIFPTAIPLFFAGTGGLVLFHIRPTGPQTSQIGHDFYFPDGTSAKAQSEFIDYITQTLATEDVGWACA
ncbi:MAG: SRPBCC family protein [Pseudomonadota bacterium]